MTNQNKINLIRNFAYKNLDVEEVIINDIFDVEKFSFPCLFLQPLPKHYDIKDNVVNYEYFFYYLRDDEEETKQRLEKFIDNIMALSIIQEDVIIYKPYDKDGLNGTVCKVIIPTPVKDTYSSVSLTDYIAGEGVLISKNKVISVDTANLITKHTFDETVAILRQEMGIMEDDLKDYVDKNVQIISKEEYDELLIKDKNTKYFIYNG